MNKDKKLLEYERKKILDNSNDKEGQIEALKKSIKDQEAKIVELQGHEANGLKSLKDMTTSVEAMVILFLQQLE